jgi:hypothetical protein
MAGCLGKAVAPHVRVTVSPSFAAVSLGVTVKRGIAVMNDHSHCHYALDNQALWLKMWQ